MKKLLTLTFIVGAFLTWNLAIGAWNAWRPSVDGGTGATWQSIEIDKSDTANGGYIGLWDTTYSDTIDLSMASVVDFDTWTLIYKITGRDTSNTSAVDLTGDSVFVKVYTMAMQESDRAGTYLLYTDTLIPGASPTAGDSLILRNWPDDSLYNGLFVQSIFHDSMDLTGETNDTDYVHSLLLFFTQ